MSIPKCSQPSKFCVSEHLTGVSRYFPFKNTILKFCVFYEISFRFLVSYA